MVVNWSEKEILAWKPPEKLTVSEWADKYRVMDQQTSPLPGPWKTANTPYLREIMDTFNDPYIQEVVFCKPTQVGGTETFNNIIGYIIDQDQSPTLVVYPTLEMAEYTSDKRLQPMFRLSPALAERFQEDRSKRLELQFIGMYLALAGANSAASLATRPMRVVIFDETDKYPPYSGKEADPISLGAERAKNFYNRKIYKASTPTLATGQIWTSLMACDVIKQYFVPCPHCGSYQTLKLAQIKWPKELEEVQDYKEKSRKVKELAWYECENCKMIIEDRHKRQMLLTGEWRPAAFDEKEGKWHPAEMPEGKARKVGYHINSIYSPWVTFGEVASQFIESKDFPEKLQNFINSWLGEPWREKAATMNSDVVLKKAWNHERGVVPNEAQIITAGVDVQKDHMWYTVRGWGPKLTSWLIEYGRVETWEELEEVIINRRYPDEWGRERIVNLAVIDTGFRTDEVYDFCALFPGVCLPGKGSSKKLNAPYTVSTIEKGIHQGLKLYIIDTEYFKDFIAGRLNKNPGEPGSWMVFKDCPREFAEHITAEHKVGEKDKKGRIVQVWRPIGSHAQNHLLDCSVMDACAAEICGVRYLRPEQPKPKEEKPKEKKPGQWIQQQNDWLKR